MEIWDLYDGQGKPLGRTAVRGEPLPEDGYHIVSDILLRHVDGDYLLMRRALDKPTHPGAWEATAGGSALAGETPLACARRELLEETGIAGRSFRKVGDCIRHDNHCWFHAYVAETDAPKDAVALQAGETIDYRWLDAEAFLRFMRSDAAIPGQVARFEAYLKDIESRS